MNQVKLNFLMMLLQSDSKYLAKRTISDKILKGKGYEIARNLNMMDIKESQQVWFIIFFDKDTGSGVSVNEQLAEKLHKPVIEKFERKNLYARFKKNISTAGLAELESLSSKNENIKYLLCAIDIFTKYACVKPLKDKKSLMLSSKQQMNLIENQVNYGLIDEENFIIKLDMNGQTITIF